MTGDNIVVIFNILTFEGFENVYFLPLPNMGWLFACVLPFSTEVRACVCVCVSFGNLFHLSCQRTEKNLIYLHICIIA